MKRTKGYLYLTVLTGGMTTLAIELSASRLFGSVFGTSNLVWANVIGLILIYLTAGYYLGGRWADRHPTPASFYGIVAWGAFLSGLTPFLAQISLPFIADLNLSVGVATALALFTLFAIPVTLLGTISPFAIRLALSSVAVAGRTAGRIYAVSTAGSVIGSLAPVLFLLPELGTQSTFMLFSMGLLLVALGGLLLHERRQALRLAWMPVPLLVLWILI